MLARRREQINQSETTSTTVTTPSPPQDTGRTLHVRYLPRDERSQSSRAELLERDSLLGVDELQRVHDVRQNSDDVSSGESILQQNTGCAESQSPTQQRHSSEMEHQHPAVNNEIEGEDNYGILDNKDMQNIAND